MIFQPSGFRRVSVLGSRIGSALAAADQVVMLPTVDAYSALDSSPVVMPPAGEGIARRAGHVIVAENHARPWLQAPMQQSRAMSS